MDIPEIYERCCAEFTTRVHSIGGSWALSTPLPDWDVRRLVLHLVYEQRWAPSVLGGATIEEVGDRFEGDLLGADPVAAFDAASAEARDAVLAAAARVPDLSYPVHLSYGEQPAHEYLMQLATDHLVHAVDLARALGSDERCDPELVTTVLEWFLPREDFYREFPVIGPRVPWPAGAGAQAELLGRMGRTPSA